MSEQILSLHQRLDVPRQMATPDLLGVIALLEDLEKANGPEILNQLVGVAFLRDCEISEELSAHEWLADFADSKGFNEVTKRG